MLLQTVVFFGFREVASVRPLIGIHLQNLTVSRRYFRTDLQLLLGDVIISLDTAVRQAAERGHTLLDELRILLVRSLASFFFAAFQRRLRSKMNDQI